MRAQMREADDRKKRIECREQLDELEARRARRRWRYARAMASSWDKLVELLTTFDALLSNVRKDIHVVRGEDDWTPPASTESADKKYEYIERAAQHVRDTLEAASSLSEAGRKKAYAAALDVVKEARSVLESLKKIPGPVAAGQAAIDLAKETQKRAEKTLDDLWDALSTGGKWFAGAAIGSEAVMIIGFAAFLYFFAVKPALERGGGAKR
jgi:hypothetical protein